VCKGSTGNDFTRRSPHGCNNDIHLKAIRASRAEKYTNSRWRPTKAGYSIGEFLCSLWRLGFEDVIKRLWASLIGGQHVLSCIRRGNITKPSKVTVTPMEHSHGE